MFVPLTAYQLKVIVEDVALKSIKP
jgi:hypothetical protein